MNRLISAIMAATLLMGATMAAAANVRCTVESVSDEQVILTCKKADKLQAGQKVEVKTKKKAGYEGC